MNDPTKPWRIRHEFTPEERAHWQQAVEHAQAERGESDEYLRLASVAAAEETFSGELRRAIHDLHGQQMFLPTLLERAQIDWPTLRAFLIGEATLPSDAIDRLIQVLGLHLHSVGTGPTEP